MGPTRNKTQEKTAGQCLLGYSSKLDNVTSVRRNVTEIGRGRVGHLEKQKREIAVLTDGHKAFNERGHDQVTTQLSTARKERGNERPGPRGKSRVAESQVNRPKTGERNDETRVEKRPEKPPPPRVRGGGELCGHCGGRTGKNWEKT